MASPSTATHILLCLYAACLSSIVLGQSEAKGNSIPFIVRHCLSEKCTETTDKDDMLRCIMRFCLPPQNAQNSAENTKRWLDMSQYKRWLDTTQYKAKRGVETDEGDDNDKRWLDLSQFKKSHPLLADEGEKRWLDMSQFARRGLMDDPKRWLDMSQFKRQVGEEDNDKRWLDISQFNRRQPSDKKWLDVSQFAKRQPEFVDGDDKKWLDMSQFKKSDKPTTGKKWLDMSQFARRGDKTEEDKKWLDMSQFKRAHDPEAEKRWLDMSQFKKRPLGNPEGPQTPQIQELQKLPRAGKGSACVEKLCRDLEGEEREGCVKSCQTHNGRIKRWVDPLNYGLDRKRSEYERFNQCFRDRCAPLGRANAPSCLRNTCMRMLVSPEDQGLLF